MTDPFLAAAGVPRSSNLTGVTEGVISAASQTPAAVPREGRGSRAKRWIATYPPPRQAAPRTDNSPTDAHMDCGRICVSSMPPLGVVRLRPVRHVGTRRVSVVLLPGGAGVSREYLQGI